MRYRLLYGAPSKCPITPWGSSTFLIIRTIGAPGGFKIIKRNYKGETDALSYGPNEFGHLRELNLKQRWLTGYEKE